MDRSNRRLRPYQERDLERLRASFAASRRRVLYQAPTGAGKTILFSAVVAGAAARGSRIMILGHRDEIVRQISEALDELGIAHGIIAAGYPEQSIFPVQVASVQTLARRLHRLTPAPDLLVIDECFPAGTLIDGTPIERLRIDDFVRSFNHETDSIEWCRITRIFRNRSTHLVTVRLCDGRTITCTANHPFCTPHGYVAAAALSSSSEVLSINDQENHHPAMHRLWSAGDLPRQNEVDTSSQRSRLLLERMSRKLGQTEFIEDNEPNQPEVRRSAHGGQQSDAQVGRSREGVGYAATCPSWSDPTSRQWYWPNNARGNAVGDYRSEALDCPDQDQTRVWVPNSLQIGPCRAGVAISYRDRWFVSPRFGAPRARCPEERVFSWARVDFVEVHQQTNKGKFDGLHRDSSVYNIEGEGNHNYFVDGVLVHNCHHAVASTWLRILDALPEIRVLGVTATPLRLDGKGLIDVFDDLIIGPTVEALIKDGYLSRFITFAPARSPDLSGVHTRAGDYAVDELAARMSSGVIITGAVEEYLRLCPGAPAIAFCVDIKHSELVAEAFTARGIHAAHVDGETPREERRAMIAALGTGELQVLSNCGLVSEGLDVPNVTAAILLRPTKSLALYLQQVGRALRPAPGKDKAHILDHAGNTFRFGPVSIERKWSLEGKEKSEPPPMQRCPDCGALVPLAEWTCPECGTVLRERLPPAGTMPQQHHEITSGRLIEVADEWLAAARYREALSWAGEDERRLHRVARARGYKPGWVWHRLQEMAEAEQ